MVGSPKHLSDLDKIDADVRIKCRGCGFEEDWSVATLQRFLFRTGGSAAWSEVTRGMRCRRLSCPSADLYAIAIPFGAKPPNMPRKVSALQAHRIDLSLRILQAACEDARRGPAATISVRLALYVLHDFIKDPQLVRDFWAAAERHEQIMGPNIFLHLRWIIDRLRRQRWLGPEVQLQEPKRWPWTDPPDEHWLRQQRSLARPGSEDK